MVGFFVKLLVSILYTWGIYSIWKMFHLYSVFQSKVLRSYVIFSWSFSILPDNVFFLNSVFSSLWSWWVGHYPQEEEDLAKFHYMSWRKVEKFSLWNCSDIFVTCWNLLSKYGNFYFFLLIMWWLRVNFSHKKKKLFVSFVPPFSPGQVANFLSNKNICV